MNRTLISILLIFILTGASAQVVVKMEMPPQNYEELSSEVLFEELLPLDITIVLSPLGYNIAGGTRPYTYKWFENNNIISQDSTVVITAGEGNDYTLVITDKNNCSDTIQVLTETSSWIENPKEKDDIINAFYSASEKIIVIRFTENIVNDVNIRLFDLSGVTLYEAKIRSDHIIPVELISGFYIIDIKGDGFHYVKKIVLQ